MTSEQIEINDGGVLSLTPLVYTIEQAAQRLGGPFTVDWLKHHMSEIPFVKTGRGKGRSGRVGFTDEHLLRIIADYTVEPAPATTSADTAPVTRRRSA